MNRSPLGLPRPSEHPDCRLLEDGHVPSPGRLPSAVLSKTLPDVMLAPVIHPEDRAQPPAVKGEGQRAEVPRSPEQHYFSRKRGLDSPQPPWGQDKAGFGTERCLCEEKHCSCLL